MIDQIVYRVSHKITNWTRWCDVTIDWVTKDKEGRNCYSYDMSAVKLWYMELNEIFYTWRFNPMFCKLRLKHFTTLEMVINWRWYFSTRINPIKFRFTWIYRYVSRTHDPYFIWEYNDLSHEICKWWKIVTQFQIIMMPR